MQTSINRLSGQSKVEMVATLKDYATKGVTSLISYGKSLAGKTWSITLKALDYATAPVKALMDLVKNPLVLMTTMAGVGVGATDTVNTFMDYEQSLANTRAVTGASDEDMATIAEMVKDKGATTAFSAADVGAASTVLGTAGWGSDSIVSGMGGILNLASAGDVSIDSAADITTSTIAQWGMEASDSTQVSDVLAATASSSKTDVEGLGETFKYAGAMASALEFSLEDTAIAAGLMGNAAIDGSQAGTSLRTMFSNLIDPTTDTATAMEKLGISVSDENGEMKSLMTVMEDMRSGFSGLTSEEQAFYASAIAGTEGLSGLLAIVNAGEEDFYSLAESIYGASGSAQEMANIRMDSLQGDLLALSSAADAVKIEIGERLQPSLRRFVQWATTKMPDVTKAFNSAFDWAGEKYTDISFKVSTVMETEEWENGDVFQKVKLTFDTLVGDPFKEWWANSGFSLSTEYAGKIGETVSGVLSGGLMVLFGVGVSDVAGDGMQIGAAFAEGFKQGFDFDGVAQGLLNAFMAVAGEASKVLPGGEDPTASSYLAAGAMAVGGAKVIGAGATAYKTGSTLISTGAQLAKGASHYASGAAGPLTGTAQAGATIAKGASKATPWLAGIGYALDGVSGASKSEEWTGGNTALDKTVSFTSGVIGGTGGGINSDESLGTKLWNVGSGVASGAVAGSMVGGVPGAVIGGAIGGVGAAIGGENLAQGTMDYFETSALAITTFWKRAGENVVATIEPMDGCLDKPIQAVGQFFGDTAESWSRNIVEAKDVFIEEAGAWCSNVSENWKYFWGIIGDACASFIDGATTFFTETVPTALEAVGVGVTTFFTVTTPEFFIGLWGGITTFFTATVPAGVELVAIGVTTFFTETVPAFFVELWDGAITFFTETVPAGVETVGEGITQFFTEDVPDFFKGLWEDVNDAFISPIKEAGEAIGTGISDFFTKAAEKVSGFFSGIFEDVTTGVSNGWNAATSLFSAHAEGGILTSPHIGLVAEDGPEAIIPLGSKRRSRGIELWERAGELLGMKPYVNGGIVGVIEEGEDSLEPILDISGLAARRGTPTISAPITIGNITFEIKVDGSGEGFDTEKLVEIIKENVANLTDEIARNLAIALKQVFANMPQALEV